MGSEAGGRKTTWLAASASAVDSTTAGAAAAAAAPELLEAAAAAGCIHLLAEPLLAVAEAGGHEPHLVVEVPFRPLLLHVAPQRGVLPAVQAGQVDARLVHVEDELLVLLGQAVEVFDVARDDPVLDLLVEDGAVLLDLLPQLEVSCGRGR